MCKVNLTLGSPEGLNEAESVTLTLYYESLCPNSIWFIVNQIYPSWLIFADEMQVIFFYGFAPPFCVHNTHIYF